MTRTGLILAALVAAACSSPVRGGERGDDHGLPPRPALGAPIDRAGRALTANALLGLTDSEEVSTRLKEQYNRTPEADRAKLIPELQRGLGLYDGFDGRCGNQWLADRAAPPAMRYRALATVLADDRLWIDSRSSVCSRYLAVELAALPAPGAPLAPPAPPGDCGGRTPSYDAVDAFRSLLVMGATSGLDDGLPRDDHEHSASEFPFLAAP